MELLAILKMTFLYMKLVVADYWRPFNCFSNTMRNWTALLMADERPCLRPLAMDSNLVHAKTSHGETAMHIAADRNFPGIIKELFKLGSALESRDNDGNGPLHIAAARGFQDCCKVLLDLGCPLNAQNFFGETPILKACALGHTATVSLLLNREADLDSANLDGAYPLHHAARHGHLKIVSVFTDTGVGLSRTDVWGRTALDGAQYYGDQRVVEFMLAHGAVQSSDSHDDNGNSLMLQTPSPRVLPPVVRPELDIILPYRAVKRISKEIEVWERDSPTHVRMIPTKDESSGYRGGAFYLEIIIPPDYPNGPPNIYFITPRFHPLVESTGDMSTGVWVSDQRYKRTGLEDGGSAKTVYWRSTLSILKWRLISPIVKGPTSLLILIPSQPIFNMANFIRKALVNGNLLYSYYRSGLRYDLGFSWNLEDESERQKLNFLSSFLEKENL
ncbi:ankyrin [Ilyonectria robusta]